ncbi:MAG: urea carboxylase [Solirubrobacteraceae bacterium]
MARFGTLLIANRGEIACAINRSAQALGLRTVAVFSEADRASPHVRDADAAVLLGPAPARESYLRVDRILAAAEATGAGAIHPGYGLLSEDAAFATAVEAVGLCFVGPTPGQLADFGRKDTARRLAAAAGVPMIAGSEVLAGLEEALAAAAAIGYPVMLKATGGGGGIGLEPCRTAADLADSFARVGRLAGASFASAGVFVERLVERARHVEVQIFGDGGGRVVALGDRDCSLQRRRQKVIEEAPAPGLPPAVRARMAAAAVALGTASAYRSAGTVEFIYDAERCEFAFLEVNARLQVEHPVTEETLGIDLVAWMLRLAQGDRTMLDTDPPPPRGHAVEARVYAEDPSREHQPSAGLVTGCHFPAGLRVETWIERGTEVGTAYDPLLAKLIAVAPTRDEAVARLACGLDACRIDGIATNLGLLRAALVEESFAEARHTTATLASVADADPRIEVLRPGTMTTVQDWPGRLGLWRVGVPPSGPMDDRSFRLGNLALGNREGAPGLECTLVGPRLRFTAAAAICLTGAECSPTLDDEPISTWEPVGVAAGQVLDVGQASGRGLRVYVLVAGGLDVPEYLGSASTFTLGRFGGHGGRALRPGDVLRTQLPGTPEGPVADRPELEHAWRIAVTEGPHAAPDFFTRADIEAFYAADWEVHFNSARTGVRLIGPRPEWARADGGEAGLHPSNIHDTPYAVGTVDFTGDVPIILGPDGPSLGGFVCPATVVAAERWKLGQLRPGDTVRFVAVSDATARRLRRNSSERLVAAGLTPSECDDGVLGRRPASDDGPEVCYRRSGDDNLLVEYGPMVLDLGLRMRVHALAERVAAERLPGLVELTPGIRSIQLHVDPDVMPVRRLVEVVAALEDELPPTGELSVPSRVVHLPLSWDDPATREATARYMAGVRADAPWCPWNIEFIRRINGLADVAEVERTVFDAEYLVLGLGDVYLGAPVATPLDPRHRLVTTKYNPARTWTPENAVGIGGAYLCIYGMEGPGGYQFVGRTTQIWSRFRSGGPFEPGSPWLLRFFDRIRWYPVGAEELLELRADQGAGRLEVAIEPGTFSLARHEEFLGREAAPIAAFRARQAEAFAAERAAWAAAGEYVAARSTGPAESYELPTDGVLLEAPMSASVWRVEVGAGARVAAGERLITLEAMKTEMALDSPVDGRVERVLVAAGDQVDPGAGLMVIVPR